MTPFKEIGPTTVEQLRN